MHETKVLKEQHWYGYTRIFQIRVVSRCTEHRSNLRKLAVWIEIEAIEFLMKKYNIPIGVVTMYNYTGPKINLSVRETNVSAPKVFREL